MARALRIDLPDTCYHVLSRGNEKRPVFYTHEDYEMFLALLGKTTDKFHVEIHAYVLMPTHYHLLVKTRQGNLSRAIQWLGVSYAGWFNRTHNRSGHLFQGRFKSFLIEDDRYFTAMCYYLHGNPVRAGAGKQPQEYAWSSARAYAEKGSGEPWLKKHIILAMNGGSRDMFCREQQAYLLRNESPLPDVRNGIYLGSEEYGRRCAVMSRMEQFTEKPQKRRLLRLQRKEQTAAEILQRLGEKDIDEQLASGRKKRPSRDVCIFIMSKLGAYTHREIGEVFHVGYTAVTGSIKRAETHIQKSSQLSEQTKEILDDIT